MAESLTDSLERILNGLARSFGQEGNATEVALLAYSKATIEQTDYDNWNGGTYGYTIYLLTPAHLFACVSKILAVIAKHMANK